MLQNFRLMCYDPVNFPIVVGFLDLRTLELAKIDDLFVLSKIYHKKLN